MTKEEFQAAFPQEFWREVVDRVAQEAPDTLLLAEAFWLMEGYFVRTLGMHRVYNSAFMNMLRNEENGKYRTLIKNTLEFEPDILKRYVNFMNNPDERTAVDQFGKGDKYFGVCVLMATLPGLPMFGHGQLEGYAEKYGMEFRKPLWDEKPDPYLVDRHRREISPLLHRRSLFAGMENFLLYDFFTTGGSVEENVLAYSNGSGSERALVVVHNRFADTEGWLRMSTAYVVKTSGADRPMIQRSLADGLGIRGEDGWFTIARDQTSGLEHIFSSLELAGNGLHLSLGAYEYHAFLDFRQVQDDSYGSYQQLCAYLAGRGVPNIEEAMHELVVQPVLNPFREIANPGFLKYLYDNRLSKAGQDVPVSLLNEAAQKYSNLLNGAVYLTGIQAGVDELTAELRRSLDAALSLPVLAKKFPMPGSRAYTAALTQLSAGLGKDRQARWLALLGWLFVRGLGKVADPHNYPSVSRSWIDEWHLGSTLEDANRALGLSEGAASRSTGLIRLLTEQQNWFSASSRLPLRLLLAEWFSDETIQRFLGVNRYKDVLWFNQEAYDEFVWWMFLVAIFDAVSSPNAGASLIAERVLLAHELVKKLLKAGKASGYQVAKLLEV